MQGLMQGVLTVKASHRYVIVAAEFNKFITAQLETGAREELCKLGAQPSQVTTIWVPGSFEIPTVAMAVAKKGGVSAIICLGCIIRGQTTHFDHVAATAASGIAAIGPATGMPAIFGVITADTQEQALDRAGLKMGNIGSHAAVAAVQMANTMADIAKGSI
jgi:6,7-dimethyl-8-ribityllumazine synthase